MNCPLKARARTGEAYGQANEAIIAYGAGALASLEHGAFREHLEVCPECRHAAEAQREVWSALDAWRPTPVPSNFDERLYARIGAYQEQSWWTRTLAEARRTLDLSWSWKPAMPVAAVCTALLAAFLLNSPAPEHHASASVQSRVDGQAEIAADLQRADLQRVDLPHLDLQQVERALDDLDMLKKLGVASTLTSARTGRS